MKITIDVFRESGKWYAGYTVLNSDDIPLHTSEFILFVWKNLPAHIDKGYVVVRDTPDSSAEQFHFHMWQYEKLKELVEFIKQNEV